MSIEPKSIQKLTSKKIYIVRHGQTNYNELGIVQGRGIDASLNEVGRKQAALFFEAYKDVPFDRVYVSTLQRTRESVQGFLDMGIPFEVHEGLDEISWGHHEGQEANPGRNAYFRSLVEQWNRGKTNVKIEGGESPEDVALRQRPVIEKIINSQDDTVLICMHGRAIRIFLCQLLGLPLSSMDRFGHSNLGLYILNYYNGHFGLFLANSTHHLGKN